SVLPLCSRVSRTEISSRPAKIARSKILQSSAAKDLFGDGSSRWAGGGPVAPPGNTRHTVQRLDRVVRQIELGGGEVLAQVRDRRGAGDQKDVRRATQQPGERDLHRRGVEAGGDIGQGGRLQRAEAADRKERHIGDALAGKLVDQGII